MSAADLGGGVHEVIERTELGLGNITASLDECKQSRNPDPQLRSVQSSCAVLEDTRKVKPTVELILSTRGLHLLHLNIRSLLPKITEIRLLSNSNKVGLFCFTETWLDDSIKDAEIEIENYFLIRRDRNRKGGGVCVYVRSDIGFNQRMDLNNDQIEAVWLNILLPKNKPILVGACYRPPDQTMFYEILELVCSKYTDFVNSEVIMIGDFNTDIRKTDLSGYKALMNFCRSFSLHQLIKEPTCVCSSTQTIIDLDLVSEKSRIADSGVRNYGLSDHSIVFCTQKIKKAVLNCHSSIRIRSLKRYSKEAFDDCLNLKNWSAVLQCNDVDKACFIFKCMFLEAVDNLAPFKVVRVKQRTEPWINDDILEAIRLRNKKYGIFRRNKDDQSWAEYKKVRNEVNRLVVNAKKAYFNEKIVEYRFK